MQKKSGVQEGSDGVGAGRDGVDKWRGSWREARDVRATEAAPPKHWASIERRRKRQTAHKDKDKGAHTEPHPQHTSTSADCAIIVVHEQKLCDG